MGACTAVGGNLGEDAFGLVALVAMTPLIAIQVLGLVYKTKQSEAAKAEQAMAEVVVVADVSDDDDIIDL